MQELRTRGGRGVDEILERRRVVGRAVAREAPVDLGIPDVREEVMKRARERSRSPYPGPDVVGDPLPVGEAGQIDIGQITEAASHRCAPAAVAEERIARVTREWPQQPRVIRGRQQPSGAGGLGVLRSIERVLAGGQDRVPAARRARLRALPVEVQDCLLADAAAHDPALPSSSGVSSAVSTGSSARVPRYDPPASISVT